MTLSHKAIRLTFVSLLLLLASYGYALAFQVASQPVPQPASLSPRPQDGPDSLCSLRDVICPGETDNPQPASSQTGKAALPVAPSGILTLKTTAFSSVECGTVWCRANAGKPAGNKVALNARFGKATAVYVPAFDTTYRVIGTTDQKTSLDFWTGDDHRAALEHGVRWLDVMIIR